MPTELIVLILKIISDIVFTATMATPDAGGLTPEQKLAVLKDLQKQTQDLFAKMKNTAAVT